MVSPALITYINTHRIPPPHTHTKSNLHNDDMLAPNGHIIQNTHSRVAKARAAISSSRYQTHGEFGCDIPLPGAEIQILLFAIYI